MPIRYVDILNFQKITSKVKNLLKGGISMYNEQTQKKLESMISAISILHKMLPKIGIGVTDREQWISYIPGEKINIGAYNGLKINPEEPLMEVIKYGKTVKADVPPEFFGLSFTGFAAPIMDDGQVIGAIAIQIQEQSERELRRISDKIVESIEDANKEILTVTKGADDVAQIGGKLLDETLIASQEMKKSDEVLTFIKRIADQTNLLGLNASIEAARAGDLGRGFGVVASEIRKLSNETVASTEKIKEILTNMQKSMEAIVRSVEEVASVGTAQASSTEEIKESIGRIERMSKELNKYASEL